MTRKPEFVALLLVAPMLMAACLTGGDEAGEAETGTAFDDETGAVEGVVTDDSLQPLAGAIVFVPDTGAVATTDEGGSFVLSRLPPGPTVVSVELEGFEARSVTVEVVAGESVTVNFALTALPSQEPYHVTYSRSGRILCGAAWRTAPNTNGTRFAACGGLSLIGNPIDVDNYITVFNMTTDNVSTVKSIAFETTWRATQAFGNGLRIEWQGYVNIVGVTTEEPLRNFVVVVGRSPLRALLDDRQIAKNVTEVQPPLKHCHAGSYCRFWAQNWAAPSTFGPSSQVDVSFYLDQPFTHYVTEFYGAYAPPHFSALPDA